LEFQEVEEDRDDWMELAQDRDRWWALVSTAKKLQDALNNQQDNRRGLLDKTALRSDSNGGSATPTFSELYTPLPINPDTHLHHISNPIPSPVSLDNVRDSLNENISQPLTSFPSPNFQPLEEEAYDQLTIDRCLQDLLVVNQTSGSTELNELYQRLFAEAKVSPCRITQEMIDEAYETTKRDLIGVLPPTKKPKKKGQANSTKRRKRKFRNYVYARTQNLYAKDPRSLAKFIREDTQWLDDSNNCPSPDSINTLSLCGGHYLTSPSLSTTPPYMKKSRRKTS
jgi:hypothetical protein